MGLFDAIADIFTGGESDSIFGSVVGAFAEPFLGGFSQPRAQQVSYMPTYSMMPSYPEPQVYPTAAGSVPAIAARAVAAGLPAWSARYPSLWQALQRLRAGGGAASVKNLQAMLSKWGPAAMTGLIGAQAVSDLVSYRMTHKSRRMNPANTKALRRSLRRLKSFDRLSGRVAMQLSRSCKPRRRSKACA